MYVHVYDSIRNTFMVELDNLLGENFEMFLAHSIASLIAFLGCENWDRHDFEALLSFG